MNKDIIIVGAFHEVIELCEECNYRIIGIIDNYLQNEYLGYPIIGNDGNLEEIYRQFNSIPLVVTPDAPRKREKLFTIYSNVGFKFETIISHYARVSKYANIGRGCIIQSDVNVSSFTTIGDFVKLNTKCNVMHDCVISNFVTIAPNSVILGKINLGRGAYIGANSTILPGLQIGSNAIIGAGAVVTKNVLVGKVVKGIPAK